MTSIKRARHISAAAATGLVQSGDWVDYGAIPAQPDAFDSTLDDRTDRNIRFGEREFVVRTCHNDDRWVSNDNHLSAGST